MSKIKNKKGMTLISLVITIIILIILSGILINASLTNTSITIQTSEATGQYKIQEYQTTIEQGVQKKVIEEAVLRQ